MIIGLILALIGGSLVSLQNIFNNKVNEHAGAWPTTTLVLCLGFLASMLMGIIFEGTHLFNMENMKTWHWFSGIIGVGVVTCMVQGLRLLGPTFAILIALSSQLAFALLWDSLGWFGLEQIPFTFKQLLGVLVIITGILVFKLGDLKEKMKASKVA